MVHCLEACADIARHEDAAARFDLRAGRRAAYTNVASA
jgi:hypothetical protein